MSRICYRPRRARLSGSEVTRGRPPIGKPLMVRIDPTLRRKLGDRADEQGISIAELCRQILARSMKARRSVKP